MPSGVSGRKSGQERGEYHAVGWSAYTKAPAVLRAAIAGSSYIVAAWRGEILVGLARAVSDEATI